LWEHLRRGGWRSTQGVVWSPRLEPYIDLHELARRGTALLPAEPPITLLRDLIPWSLNYWLVARDEALSGSETVV
jgi:hypothetical protein